MTANGTPKVWQATWLVAQKELVTSFRDRQMAIYAVVLPICMYPVLFWLMIQGALLVQGRREHTDVHVGVAHATGVEVPADLYEALSYAPGASEVEEGVQPLEFLEPHTLGMRHSPEDVWAELRSEDAEHPTDAILYLGADGDEPAVLAHDSTDSRSELAKRRLERRLERYAEERREAAAVEAGVDVRALRPVVTETRNLAPDEVMGAFLLSIILPLLLVVMAVMGAFYPSVDLTAGERERGTAETTTILPIPRLAVHQGKILAVCASALLATSLNLVALALSATHLLKMLGDGVDIEIELPIAAFFQVAPLALLFTFTVSAILTGFAALARSFKEGQALLGPVQMIFILPSMAGVLPGLELTPQLALVPVVNVVLAFRGMLRGDVQPLEYGLTALSLLVYAVLAILFARRILSRESLGLSSETIPITRLFRFLRSDTQSR